MDKLRDIFPLSLEYDKFSILKPYTTRVKSALLTLMFFEKITNHEFNFMTQDSYDFLKSLSQDMEYHQKNGLESNQIFLLMFNESVNQSIISDSGIDFENRVLSVLNKIGISNITKTHDKIDKSTEYDFFFELDNKFYGIGAKKTLRERYKQFIKTSKNSDIDVMIEITLGIDLNESTANIITENGTIVFVADEIYNHNKFLHSMKNIYSSSKLSLKLLKILDS